MRSTKQKEVILKVLKTTTSHPTAQWVHEQARKMLPNLSLGTVYRNLKLLNERGEVDELSYGKYPSRYELHTDRHHHVLCVMCGRVDDVACDETPQLIKEAAQRSAYKIIDHQVRMLGICPTCQASPHQTS